MDRIGTLEVLSLLAHDYGLYGVFGRLQRLGLRVANSRQFYDGLEDWQQELYIQLESRAEATHSTDLYLVHV